MVQTLEAIRGGGGSIKVGTIGTISSLMTRELESSTSSTSHAPSSSKQTQVPKSHHVNAPHLEPKNSGDQASSSALRAGTNKQKVTLENNKGSSNVSKGINRKNADVSGRIRSHKRSSNTLRPSSRDTQLEKTPLREKPRRNGSNIVDIVDLNCGDPAGSISNRLKKLGLSRMSQSFM